MAQDEVNMRAFKAMGIEWVDWNVRVLIIRVMRCRWERFMASLGLRDLAATVVVRTLLACHHSLQPSLCLIFCFFFVVLLVRLSLLGTVSTCGQV